MQSSTRDFNPKFSFLKLLFSIFLSVCVALSIGMRGDELATLHNIYMPILMGGATILIWLISAFFFSRSRIRSAVLSGLLAINILTGVLLKMKFHSFLKLRNSYISCTSGIPLQRANYKADGILVESLQPVSLKGAMLFSLVEKELIHGLSAKNIQRNKALFRLSNKSSQPLVINSEKFSQGGLWKISHINDFETDKSLFPFIIEPGKHADITVTFTADNICERTRSLWWKLFLKLQYISVRYARLLDYQFPMGALNLHIDGCLTLATGGAKKQLINIPLSCIWQYESESDWEPSLQMIVNTFGFSTKIGFNNFDGAVHGQRVVPGTDELPCAYFIRASDSVPVKITQLAAYHSCCLPSNADSLYYYSLSDAKAQYLFKNNASAGQMIFPKIDTGSCCPGGAFYPQGPFAIKSRRSYTDRNKNYEKKIAIRIWRAIDGRGKVIAHAYILGSDYLGSAGTNYDYQDDVYFVQNVVPVAYNQLRF